MVTGTACTVTPETPIDEDIACQKCRYNLRTLAVTGRCPECGFPILRSLIAFQAAAHVTPAGLPDTRRATQAVLVILSRLLNRNVDAIQFVVRAHRYAQERLAPRTPLFGRPGDVSAADLCRAVAEYGLEHYGSRDQALSTFRFWRLECSEDVGSIVSALVEAGLLTPGPHDSPADFVGICRFEDLISSG